MFGLFEKDKQSTMPQRVAEFERKLSAVVIEAKLQNVSDATITRTMQTHIDGMKRRAAVTYGLPSTVTIFRNDTMLEFITGAFVGIVAVVTYALHLGHKAKQQAKPTAQFTAPIGLDGNSLDAVSAKMLNDILHKYGEGKIFLPTTRH